MGKEIERKFLVNKENWAMVYKPEKSFIRQGYIVTNPEKTIRVRCYNGKGFLTLKGLTVGAVRDEFEYEIPYEDANEMLSLFAVTEISKFRYKIIHSGKLWEVDEFEGRNKGLILAEIELSAEDEKFEIPEWAGEEVTGNEKYYNSNLSETPF